MDNALSLFTFKPVLSARHTFLCENMHHKNNNTNKKNEQLNK